MNKRWLLVPVVLLALAALACAAPGGSTALYSDNFSNSSGDWCVDSDSQSSTDYSGGKFVIEVLETEFFVWCNPDQSFEDIHIEVTAVNVNDTADTIFGIMCHHQLLDDFYYVGITSQGEYTIRLFQDDADVILTEGTSDSIASNAESYRIGMDCGEGRLALYVDGNLIDEAEDATYTTGDIGLYVWSLEEVPAQVTYDDLEVTELGAEVEE
jgi:hypothetical protein